MSKGYSADALAQLEYGEGQVLYGDGALVLLKALLQAGVAYLGGYPGSPVAHLMDAISDAYGRHLEPRGIYFDQSANEASAAALLAASLTEPIRGAVCWKHNGNTVAADALNHLSLVGVTGGCVAIVGEDYGLESSAAPVRTGQLAHNLLMPCFDPRGDLQLLADLLDPAFALSEYSGLPVFYLARSRVANLQDAIRCKDNRPLGISAAAPAATWQRDPRKFPLRPHNLVHQGAQLAERLPRAQAFVRDHRLNELFPGRHADVGIITHGTTYNVVRRALERLGLLADGTLPVPIYHLNVVYPLVPEEVTGFLAGKRAVFVVEEGRPDVLESELRAIAAGLPVRFYGCDLLPRPGELTPEGVLEPLARFLAAVLPGLGGLAEQVAAVGAATARAREFFARPVPGRPPAFCSGCPERPVFTALKLLEEETGEVPYYAGDVGCYGMSSAPPFAIGDSNLGMGLGLASGAGVARMSREKVVSFMGDGTFWHSGLGTSIANAVYNRQPSTLVLFENYWTAMTGDQENPSTGRNMKGQDVGPASLERALKGVGVRWVRRVRSFSVGRVRRLLRAALFRRGAPGEELRVLVARGECVLASGRRVAGERARRLAAGQRVVVAQYGVDPEVCNACRACLRLNGCPSLTLGPPRRPGGAAPAASAASCTGGGRCGERGAAAGLCPSFYRVDVIRNAGWWERAGAWFLRRLARGRAAA